MLKKDFLNELHQEALVLVPVLLINELAALGKFLKNSIDYFLPDLKNKNEHFIEINLY